MTYVDGFISAVPTANKDAYLRHARVTGAVFRDHGALTVVECWGDDLPEGHLTSMPLAVRRQEHETVCLSWVTWPDKATRDAALMKVFTDPRMRPDQNPAPYDGKRIIRGGFEVLFETLDRDRGMRR
ncbi:DUF1428 domain-containing protein [Tabrizicola sp.]|uniref:DUF1428 domain-containing protein n=1 Tax=Tabrizicola sp. TaxID=2005166 RepID=UPI003F3064A0